MVGTMTLPGVPGLNRMTFTSKAPNSYHMRLDIPGFGVSSEGCDGKIVWTNNSLEGTVRLAGEKLELKRRDSSYYRYFNFESEFVTLAYEGREAWLGKSCDVVKGTDRKGRKELLYFDARTDLLSLVKRPDSSIQLSDYRKVQGVQMPFSVVVVATGKEGVSLTMKIEQVRFGDEVDDALFAMPKE